MTAKSDSLAWGSTYSKPLFYSGLAALALECLVFFCIGLGSWHPLLSIQTDPMAGSAIETEIIEIPKLDHLINAGQSADHPQIKEKAIRLIPKPKIGPPSPPSAAEPENITQPGTDSFNHTHGPLLIYKPKPHFPSYLRDQQFKKEAVFDFHVSASGEATPRLVGSTGNEELDALAIAAAKQYIFKPAERDLVAVDAVQRVRMRFIAE